MGVEPRVSAYLSTWRAAVVFVNLLNLAFPHVLRSFVVDDPPYGVVMGARALRLGLSLLRLVRSFVLAYSGRVCQSNKPRFPPFVAGVDRLSDSVHETQTPQENHPLSPLHEPLQWRDQCDPKATMLSLQILPTEGRFVGQCWEKSKPQDLKDSGLMNSSHPHGAGFASSARAAPTVGP
jgi:hypothetical protein